MTRKPVVPREAANRDVEEIIDYYFGEGTPQASASSPTSFSSRPRDELQRLKLVILADLTAEGVDRIDLIALDGADPVMCFEAVHPNCLVFARPDFDHGQYLSRALREYFDLEPYLRIQREAFKRRVLSGQA